MRFAKSQDSSLSNVSDNPASRTPQTPMTPLTPKTPTAPNNNNGNSLTTTATVVNSSAGPLEVGASSLKKNLNGQLATPSPLGVEGRNGGGGQGARVSFSDPINDSAPTSSGTTSQSGYRRRCSDPPGEDSSGTIPHEDYDLSCSSPMVGTNVGGGNSDNLAASNGNGAYFSYDEPVDEAEGCGSQEQLLTSTSGNGKVNGKKRASNYSLSSVKVVPHLPHHQPANGKGGQETVVHFSKFAKGDGNEEEVEDHQHDRNREEEYLYSDEDEEEEDEDWSGS